MKRQILSALAIASMVAGSVTVLSVPAQANASCVDGGGFRYDRTDFKAWEHPFFCDRNIRKMPQAAADGYCNSVFGAYALGELTMYNRVVKSSHIWAHVWDGLCVYNN